MWGNPSRCWATSTVMEYETLWEAVVPNEDQHPFASHLDFIIITCVCPHTPGPYSVRSHDNSWKFCCKYNLNLHLNETCLTISFAPFVLKWGSCWVNNVSKKFYMCHFSLWYVKGIVISWNSLIILKTGQPSCSVLPHFSESMCEVEKSLGQC